MKIIGAHSERISKIIPLIHRQYWEDINLPTRLCYWRKFEASNKSAHLKVLFVEDKTVNHTN